MRKNSIKLMAIAALLLAVSPASAQQPMGNRCFTPQFWCWLPGFGPIGSPCYCNTPYGPVTGVVG